MPDHVHVLISDPAQRTAQYVWRFKQATGYQWKQQGNPGTLWQRGFYDRVLRLDDDPNIVAKYIMTNPVRAGLAARAADYRFSGAPAFPLLLL